MSDALPYKTRERYKRIAYEGSEADVRAALLDAVHDPTVIALFRCLPIAAAREALTGAMLWHRLRACSRDRVKPLEYLAQWAWWIEPEGRWGMGTGTNALQAFIPRPSKPLLPRGTSY